MYFYTESGKEILDLTSGFGTQNLGYNNDEIVNERIAFAKNNELPFSRLFFNENVAKLAKKISSMLPGDSSILLVILVQRQTKVHLN